MSTTNKFKLTKEMQNHLVDTAAQRAKSFGLKGKKAMLFQHELFIGAVATLDFLNQTNQTSMPPNIYVDILRGQLISKQS